MTDRKVMQQALEALESGLAFDAHSTVLQNLRKALAQPEQEPVSCRFCHDARGCWTWQCYTCGEIDDVQQPAAQPVQEPVAWELEEYDAGLLSNYGGGNVEWWQDYIRVELSKAYDHYQSQTITPSLPVQPVQEPVAYVKGTYAGRLIYDTINPAVCLPVGMAFYNAPPQREWVGLTEDEIKGTWAQLWYDLTHGKLSTPDNEVRNNVVMFGQALEAKLKEKNNG